MKLFGTNGIRGIADTELTREFNYRVGKSIGKTTKAKVLAIATDTRVSSERVKKDVEDGVMSQGISIIELGIVPTPALQYYIKTHDEVQGGIMITASHNPPQYNGIKCISGDGTEYSKDEEKAVEDAFDTDISEIKSQCWLSQYDHAGEDYVNSIVTKVDVGAIRRAKLKVCLDCSNGASYRTSPMLMKILGVETIILNDEPDGTFPGHESEPTEKNLRGTIERVAKEGADIGIVHDGDADRVVFISDGGKYVDGNSSLALLSKYEIQKNGGKGKIVAPVATSFTVRDAAIQSGGEFVFTAVGSPIVARRMIADNGIFGGEENGGLIFARHQFCRDGAMGAAAMLENIALNGKLSTQIANLPRYYTIKETVMCTEESKPKIIAALPKMIDGNIDTTDGFKILFDDGWVLIRASGTEPKFRVYSESSSEDNARERMTKYFMIVKSLSE